MAVIAYHSLAALYYVRDVESQVQILSPRPLNSLTFDHGSSYRVSCSSAAGSVLSSGQFHQVLGAIYVGCNAGGRESRGQEIASEGIFDRRGTSPQVSGEFNCLV